MTEVQVNTKWFPIRVRYKDTNEEVVVRRPEDLERIRGFQVLELKVKEEPASNGQ